MVWVELLVRPGADPLGGLPIFVGNLRDISRQKAAEDQLAATNAELVALSLNDPLTGIANRRHFDEVLLKEWKRAIREQTALSLILLDIDRFKSFNDMYGHLAGDNCLRTVAGAVASVVKRPSDLAVRYGGEEFALILPVTEAEGAESVAYTARAAIEALGLTHAGNALCGGVVTASFGVSTAYPQAGGPPEAALDLIAQADALLYEAKRTGRNRVVSPANIDCDGAAPLPDDEAERLEALAIYEQAGATRRTAELDRIARLAATLMSAPIGLVSLVGQDEQRFAGNFGLEGMDSIARSGSLCAHTILGDDPFVVPDATRDSRFAQNALVTGDFGLRYYAGAPIISETTGHRLGALCVIDKSARAETSQAQHALLTDLAHMAARLLDEKMASSI